MEESKAADRGLAPQQNADKAWYLSLLDQDAQRAFEEGRLSTLLSVLKLVYVNKYRKRISALKKEIAEISARKDYSAADYTELLEKKAALEKERKKLDGYKCFFCEPYFARMDVCDGQEGYNSYYIGKKGDVNLEIVDWRAPLAVRYYQKSRVNFSINEYDYRVVLRRALSVKNGKLLDFKNEYLSVKDVLAPEEIAGRDEEILFDPYLRSIIQSRKDDTHIRDIIRTIQEKQFDIVTLPERESFVLQGCAGSGKTMILLHRLSYLMYNNEALSPKNVLVLTPSDSFNAFIDELAQVLELKKVTTTTLKSYFFRTLQNEGIELKLRADGAREDKKYLAYLYSSRFPEDVKKKIRKLFDGVYGLIAGKECRSVAEEVLKDCVARQKKYAQIKNASVRVRRAVLGEMKDDKAGGFYFTKPFRMLMSCLFGVEDFLSYALNEEVRPPDLFFRRFAEFYRALKYASVNAEEVFSAAISDLGSLRAVVEKEISELERYRARAVGFEAAAYAERIARREELLREISLSERAIADMGGGISLLNDFFRSLRDAPACSELGKCRGGVDIARWLYRETVKKTKTKYGMQGLYPSDGYALCLVLTEAGRRLSPRYGLVFVDEGQDVSAGEYALLRRIHADAAFNVFGDLKQNITPWRGIGSWDNLGYPVHLLDQNYRNTNEIVDFVSGVLDVEMRSIGLAGAPILRVPVRKLSAFFREKQGLKAVIAREEYLPLFKKRGYKLLSTSTKLSQTQVNVMSVYESKGLEFSAVAVYDKGMSENEKYIAYTRALRELAVVED